jgi:hypothetical protein
MTPPLSLTYLQFGLDFNQKVDKLPKSIKIILFHENYKNFNHSLNHLKDVRIEYFSY